MNRTILIVIAVVLSYCIKWSATFAQDHVADSNDIRRQIVATVEQAKELAFERSMRSPDSAIKLLESAATTLESHFANDDTLLARVYYYLGRCHYYQAAYDQAADFSNKAIEIWQTAPGSHHIRILEGLNTVIDCARDRNDLILWELSSERRFALLEALDEPLSPWEQRQMVKALHDRGVLLSRQNRYDEALSDFYSGLELLEIEVLDVPKLRADLTRSIGVLFATQGHWAEAEKYMLRALDLTKEAYHPKHSTVLHTYIGLSNVVVNLGEPIRANRWVDSSLALARELDYSHPVLSSLYRSRAKILIALDSVESAVENIERAVAINLVTSPYSTERLMWCLETAGRIAFSAGKVDLGVRRFDELVTRRQTFLKTVFGYASEDQKLAYLKRYQPIYSVYLSGAVTSQAPKSIRGVTNMLLNGKGLAIDALVAEQTAAVCSEDPVLDSLLADRKSTCSEIARLSLSGRSNDEAFTKRLGELYARKDLTEKEMSNTCSDLVTDLTASAISASMVASVLPEHSVLWEFAKYRRYDLDLSYKGDGSLGEYYIGVALTPDDSLKLFDLGSASVIDSLIEELQSAMADALHQQLTGRSDASTHRFNQVSAELYMILITPLEETLTGADEVYVAADGAICLLPFETLTRDGERYLIEGHQFVYLTSGRDLLRKEPAENGCRDAIVMADPDYMIDPTTLPAIAPKEPSPILEARGNIYPPECLASMFSPLPLTRREGSAVAELLGQTGGLDVSYFESSAAGEGVLKSRQQAPRVLHIATHGYFCAESDRDALSNPLLRSGLVLAGANRTIGQLIEERPDTEDGILTALEVSGLNLIGTDLVVLSACHTGVGEVQSGEGVFGLRRAFQHAGARSIVMSMFAVPDESTVTLMERFYENWQSGRSKSAALRNASLSILNERRKEYGTAHPLFWGGFILVGTPN